MNTQDILLASGSPSRKRLLENAGIAVRAVKAEINERSIEAPLEGTGVSPEDVALILAEAKAQEVSQRFPEQWVIGADQTLSLEGKIFHKPADMEGARQHLLALSGQTHHLNAAVVLARNRE